MGVWGLDIYDDDLAVDIRDEFEGYLADGMEAEDAVEELLGNNENLLEEVEDCGTFVLTVGFIAKDNDVNNKTVQRLLKELKKNKEYWNYLKEDSENLYEVRKDFLNELL